MDTWLTSPLWKEINKVRFALRNTKGEKRLKLLDRLEQLNKELEALPRDPPTDPLTPKVPDA
jgi:hypothetical protein